MPRNRSQHPLSELCDESPHPIYALDDQRRIVACNRACAEWLGISAERLIGQRCDYATHETAVEENVAAAALCPPPQTFLGEMTQGSITWRHGEQVETRSATFMPLNLEEPAAILVVLGAVHVVDSDSSQPTENASATDLHQRLQQLARKMRTRYRLDGLVGESPSIRRVRAQVAAAIASQARVLIVGPPGSGREHVARTIVYADQPEQDRLLLPLDCTILDVELLRTSISSVERPSTNRPVMPVGPVAALLLLEVDQLGAPEQTALAAALRSNALPARVLATAHRPLVELAAAGSFDRDLAFDLSTLVVELPALRDRREDIPLLAQRMVEEHNANGGRQLAGFAPAALDRLASLPWTGNVEELLRVVREACQSVSTVWIGEADLPAHVRTVVAAGLHPRRVPEPIQLDAFLLEVERELIERAMRRAKANKSQAARLLGISRARLLRRLEQLGMISREKPVIEFHPED